MWITTKPAVKAKEEHNADFISEMPNEIVCHIISFLPVADAFSIKLLSRRFRRTRVPLSNLYFNKETIFGEKYFNFDIQKLKPEFVGKVNSFLKLFRGMYLNAFVVEFCLDHEFAPVIDNWIRLAISMEVESVELNFDFFHGRTANIPNLYKFPFLILPKPKSLTRLKHLKLSKCSLDLDHSPLSFNCLKTIVLKMLPLDQTSLDRLLSSCSELESLTIDRCETPHKLIVCSDVLTALHIRFCFETTHIVLNSAALQTFVVRSQTFKRVAFVVVPPLQRVHLGFVNPYRLNTFYVPLRKIRHKLQFLSLGWFNDISVPANIPEFVLLKRLDFFQFKKFDLLSITNILNVCPLLQKLHVDLKAIVPRSRGDRTEKVVVSYSETVIYSNLEEIEISGFVGTSDEMEFVKYLLKHAVSLKHVKIIYSRWKSDEYKWQNAHTEILLIMSQNKQLIYDSLHKGMTSREAILIIC